jgi:hypothetical protein
VTKTNDHVVEYMLVCKRIQEMRCVLAAGRGGMGAWGGVLASGARYHRGDSFSKYSSSARHSARENGARDSVFRRNPSRESKALRNALNRCKLKTDCLPIKKTFSVSSAVSSAVPCNPLCGG